MRESTMQTLDWRKSTRRLRCSVNTLCGLFVLAGALIPQAQAAEVPTAIQQMWAAHGGLDTWKRQAGVEFTCLFHIGGQPPADRQTFDLRTRNGVIKSTAPGGYTLGYDGADVWVTPSLESLGGRPARFYMWTPFYFFILPFAMADDGVILTPQEPRTFEGKTYEVVKATYAAGTGDAPEDYYILFLDPETHMLRLAIYIVTYPSLRKTDPETGRIPESAIAYDTWQTVDGLKLPAKVRFFRWKGDAPDGEPKGTGSFSDVVLSTTPPDPALFQKPPNAVIDPLPKPAS